MKRVVVLVSTVALCTAVATGCGSQNTSGQSPTTAGGGTTNLVVFAAASLKQSFTEIGEKFKADNPTATVEFSFAGSSDLVTQLEQGAKADVFASADTPNMDKAATANLLAGEPVDFASNTLTIAVAPGNPKGIATLADLTEQGLNVVVCAPQVPCGAATEKVEKAADLQLNPVSEESSVTDVLNKVTSGEADAGLVYVTDVLGADDKVDAVAFPETSSAVNTYPIATLKESAHAELADTFVAYVTGEQGQQVLDEAGFAKP